MSSTETLDKWTNVPIDTFPCLKTEGDKASSGNSRFFEIANPSIALSEGMHHTLIDICFFPLPVYLLGNPGSGGDNPVLLATPCLLSLSRTFSNILFCGALDIPQPGLGTFREPMTYPAASVTAQGCPSHRSQMSQI